MREKGRDLLPFAVLVAAAAAMTGLAETRPSARAAPPQRILITAFEPFGDRRANASLGVLSHLQAEYGDRFDYLVVPVSAAGEARLLRRLAEQPPAAVVGLGEDVQLEPGRVNLEPRAFVAPVSRDRPPVGTPTLESPWAIAVARALGLRLRGDVGLFFCNRVYLHSLRWAQRAGNRPALFVHVPGNDDPCRSARRVAEIVETLARLLSRR